MPLVWRELYPSAPLYEHSWHYDYLAEHMQLFYERKTLFLIVNIPPRTLKTLFLSIAFPTWVWAKDPLPSFIGGSFDSDLADELNGKRRRIIKSAAYQRLFGHRVEVLRGVDREDHFANTRGGEMRGTTPKAGITGRGGDFLLLDDILSPAQADSPVISKSVFEWVDETFLQRRNNLGKSPLALIEQRVHEYDMTAHLLKILPREMVTHISIPLVAEKEERYEFPISKRVVVREKNDVLLPGRFTPDVVRVESKRTRIWVTQYQGRPIAKAGKTFKREWFRFYGPKSLGYERQLPPIPEMEEICQSWDATFKKKEDSDFVCGQVWARKGGDKYLIDRAHDQMSFTETIKAILTMRLKHPYASRIYIEDKANGPAIIDMLQTKVGGIIAVEPLGSKEARAEAASADAESGNIYLPCPELSPWVNEFVDYMVAFPGPLNDDDVDAYSQAINKMREGSSSLEKFYERLIASEQRPLVSVFDLVSE